MAAIEAVNLLRRFRAGEPDEVRAVDGVTLEVQAGELVSVVGRAGSGKSTLLRLLGLLLRPTTGQLLIEGVEVTDLDDGQRASLRGRRIGFVFREPNLLPTLTVLQNVVLPLRYGWPIRGGRQRARELLDLVELGDRLQHRPAQLSRAEAQRAAIARALIRMPAAVLADEPTGELDDEAADELIQLLQKLNRMSGRAFVIATQDAEVGACCDRMVRLRDGRVASDERTRVDLGRLRQLR
jgi:putative ABC transport system ATP-binding protein